MLPALLLSAAPCDPHKALCKDTAGPGLGLQIFLVLAVVGVAATAWFLLRGYRNVGRRDDEPPR
jgi:hypothetical protein